MGRLSESDIAVSTPKIAAPVVGFNHNLKHGGRVFHVQTEDSGLPRAHFLTHLYIGGNIIASAKGSYADKLAEPDLPQLVRKLMEEQHKAMVRRLVAGEFTEQAARFSPHYEPGVLASGQTGPAAVNTAATESVSANSPAPNTAAPVAAAPRVAPVARTAKKPPASSSGAPIIGTPMIGTPTKSSAPNSSVASAFDELPAPSSPPHLPARAARAPAQAGKPSALPVQPAPRSAPVLVPASPAVPMVGRPTPGPILFAEELISDRSLDEVILAFLASGGEPETPKK